MVNDLEGQKSTIMNDVQALWDELTWMEYEADTTQIKHDAELNSHITKENTL